jgi:hypothetical protein
VRRRNDDRILRPAALPWQTYGLPNSNGSSAFEWQHDPIWVERLDVEEQLQMLSSISDDYGNQGCLSNVNYDKNQQPPPSLPGIADLSQEPAPLSGNYPPGTWESSSMIRP